MTVCRNGDYIPSQINLEAQFRPRATRETITMPRWVLRESRGRNERPRTKITDQYATSTKVAMKMSVCR